MFLKHIFFLTLHLRQKSQNNTLFTHVHNTQNRFPLHMINHSSGSSERSPHTILCHRHYWVHRHPTWWSAPCPCHQTTSTYGSLLSKARSSSTSCGRSASCPAHSCRPCCSRWPGRRALPCRSLEPRARSGSQWWGGTTVMLGSRNLEEEKAEKLWTMNHKHTYNINKRSSVL